MDNGRWTQHVLVHDPESIVMDLERNDMTLCIFETLSELGGAHIVTWGCVWQWKNRRSGSPLEATRPRKIDWRKEL
jgi:hypothetical protein